ncbi:MAG TPA: M1 family aminopeptidase [Vicinamibacterales bacterium]|jgi:hypothetical protein
MKHLVLAIVCAACLSGTAWAQPASSTDGVAALLGRLEQVVRGGDAERYADLLSGVADRERAMTFARSTISPAITRVVVRERDRAELAGNLPGDGYQLLLEVFIETGVRARLTTWRLDVRRRGRNSEEWGIAYQELISTLQGLYRLALNPRRQMVFKDLVVTAEDLRLTVAEGSLFVADVDGGATAFVVLGHGEMSFAPGQTTERGQVRLFSGAETLQSGFEAFFFRINPGDLGAHARTKEIVQRPVDPRDFKRADEIFRQELGKSFGLDLGEMSSDTWSLLPGSGDFLAEIRTRRFDTLTYTRSSNEIEDISLYDRRNRRNIAVYSSQDHLRSFTRFYDEDDKVDYRVHSYDIDVSFAPARRWIEGRARLDIEIQGKGSNTITLRLADSLSVRSVTSGDYGRLLCVRVHNQNSVVVNLPATLVKGTRTTLTVMYSGTLQPQSIDHEALTLTPQMPQFPESEQSEIPLEESFLYSNRSYWYPQATTASYANATMRIVVPEPYSCAASGDPVSTEKLVPSPQNPGSSRAFSFIVSQPARYLSFIVASLAIARHEKVALAPLVEAARALRSPGVYYDDLDLSVRTNPRLRARGPDMARSAGQILRFYTSLVGDCPYPTLTAVAVERRLPGGHSPAYLSVISLPTATGPIRWADDPASFPDFPEFFLAHEIAHQWWGQAIGWKNYHEQWLSEGISQYFAALYAEKARGRGVFDSIIRRMHRWGVGESNQGPVFLGYRIGHIKGESRTFRAVVYNKSAMVLHMLRRLLGDQVFFGGLRRFYDTWRFRKAGSEDLRQAMEQESGMNLERFFERWIYGDGLPEVTFTSRVEDSPAGPVAVLHFEQTGEVYDVPVTVTLDYTDRPAADLIVKLTDKTLETRVPLAGKLRKIDINRDEAALLK